MEKIKISPRRVKKEHFLTVGFDSSKKSPAGSQYSSIEYHREKMDEISGKVSQNFESF